MDLLLPARNPRLEPWKTRDFNGVRGKGDKELVFEKVIAREPPGPPIKNGPQQKAAAAILRYEVFPPHVIRAVIERAPVEIGDTVGIEYQIAAGVRWFFAARVVERFDAANNGVHKTGFTYRTLRGHPEIGEEAFSAEKDLESGAVLVKLESWSRPGLFITRVSSRLLRIVQRRASEAALVYLERAAQL